MLYAEVPFTGLGNHVEGKISSHRPLSSALHTFVCTWMNAPTIVLASYFPSSCPFIVESTTSQGCAVYPAVSHTQLWFSSCKLKLLQPPAYLALSHTYHMLHGWLLPTIKRPYLTLGSEVIRLSLEELIGTRNELQKILPWFLENGPK